MCRGSATLSPSGAQLLVYNTKTGLDFINTSSLQSTNTRLKLSVSTRPLIHSAFTDDGTVVCYDENDNLHVWNVNTETMLQKIEQKWGMLALLLILSCY
jgi:hypothetical protein